jgi:hypothetical protein
MTTSNQSSSPFPPELPKSNRYAHILDESTTSEEEQSDEVTQAVARNPRLQYLKDSQLTPHYSQPKAVSKWLKNYKQLKKEVAQQTSRSELSSFRNYEGGDVGESEEQEKKLGEGMKEMFHRTDIFSKEHLEKVGNKLKEKGNKEKTGYMEKET